MRSCLGSNCYFVTDLLIIMNIKREILKSLEHYAKIYLVKAKTATRKPNNSNIKHSVTAMSYLNNKFYYINDLLILITLNERY